MATTAPPFSAAHSPHLDIELRELYGRVMAAERAIGIGEGTVSVPPVTDLDVRLVEATPVKLLQGFVRFDEGWPVPEAVPERPQPKRGPILLGAPVPPFVVLDVFVNLDVVFNYDLSYSMFFGVGTTADTEVNQRFYYAGTAQDASILEWPGADLVLTRPTSSDRYTNIGVVQTASRPIVAGFFRNTAAPTPFPDWPADMEGQVHVLVTYADSDTGGQSVSLAELANLTLLSPSGLA